MLPNSAGVYLILNNKYNKVYVGSTINLRRRIFNHFSLLKRGVHHCTPLQVAYDKYSYHNFSYLILEIIEDTSILKDREQFWLNKYARNYYNINTDAHSPKGRIVSESLKEKLRLLNTGRVVSNATREKMRKSWKPNPNLGMPRKPINQILNGVVIKTFNGLIEASEITGIRSGDICMVASAKYRNKSAGGYVWEYA